MTQVKSTGHCSIDKLPNQTDSPESNRAFLLMRLGLGDTFNAFICIMVTCTLTCGKVTCILDTLSSMCMDHVLIFVAHAIYYLTCASIKAVVYELQLLYKSHFCRKLNDMKKTLVLQTPHMEKSRSGQLHVQRKFIITVFCQVIWKWHSIMITITCKLTEHR